MADNKVTAPRIQLVDFLNSLPEIKSGRVEILGAFDHYMENVKKITTATEAEFKKFFEDFKNLSV